MDPVSKAERLSDLQSELMDEIAEVLPKLRFLEWLLQVDVPSSEGGKWEKAKTLRKATDMLEFVLEENPKTVTLDGHNTVAGTKEQATFDRYLDLPPQLVRSKIIDFLTPGDRLNLLKAIPGEAVLLSCSQEELQFQVDFEKEAESSKFLGWNKDIGVSSLRLISLSSPFKKAVILRRFENLLTDNVNSPRDECYQGLTSIYLKQRWLNEKMSLQLWSQFPDLRRISTSLWQWKENFEILPECGAVIWDATVYFHAQTPEHLPRYWITLAKYLRLLPQLRNFTLQEKPPGCSSSRPDRYYAGKDGDTDQFPVLPFLKSLKFFDNYTPDGWQFFQRLVEAYGPQLNQLHVRMPWNFEPKLGYFGVCRSLTILNFKGRPRMPGGPQNVSETAALALLSALSEAPLKTIKLENLEYGRESFCHLVSCLSQHFGSTLEYLEITGNECKVHAGEDLKDLRFPKLTHFSSSIQLVLDGVNDLLAFPALETLDISFEDMPALKYWVWLPTLKRIKCWGMRMKCEEGITQEQHERACMMMACEEEADGNGVEGDKEETPSQSVEM